MGEVVLATVTGATCSNMVIKRVGALAMGGWVEIYIVSTLYRYVSRHEGGYF